MTMWDLETQQEVQKCIVNIGHHGGLYTLNDVGNLCVATTDLHIVAIDFISNIVVYDLQPRSDLVSFSINPR